RKFISQRDQARMCLISTQLTEDSLQLNAAGLDPLSIDMRRLHTLSSQKIEVVVWNDRCKVYDCGDVAAEWLSQFLEVECRLMYFPDDAIRPVDPAYADKNDKTAFSDGFPILLTSEASLQDLNSRLKKPIDMRRFRPNIVVSGSPAFDEDQWRLVTIGDVTYRMVKPCARCGIPNIDPNSAERGAEPSRTLIQYRRRNGKIFFGQNIIANSLGNIKVGMRIKIVERVEKIE
ncbi:MAG: MOSC domain-containing protein, partial [Thiohalomonadales bacterium]